MTHWDLIQGILWVFFWLKKFKISWCGGILHNLGCSGWCFLMVEADGGLWEGSGEAVLMRKWGDFLVGLSF